MTNPAEPLDSQLRRKDAQIDELTQRLSELENRFNFAWLHGLKDLGSGSGNQYYGGKIMRLGPTGIQIKGGSINTNLIGMAFLNDFQSSLASVSTPHIKWLGNIDADEAQSYIYTKSNDDSSPVNTYSMINQYSKTNDQSFLWLVADRATGSQASLTIIARTGLDGANIFAGYIKLASKSSEWDNSSNGVMGFRSDTVKFRGYAGGWKNFAMEDWVTAAIAASGGASPWTPVKVLSVASTNGTVVKASAGTLGPFTLVNTNAATRYFHLYDSTSVTVGTTVPKITFAIPASATGKQLNFITSIGIPFSTGICYGLTTGAGDNDSGAVALNEITGVINYS